MEKAFAPLSAREREKYALAEEMGLTEKLLAHGWAGLTAAESGRIGGRMARRGASARRAPSEGT